LAVRSFSSSGSGTCEYRDSLKKARWFLDPSDLAGWHESRISEVVACLRIFFVAGVRCVYLFAAEIHLIVGHSVRGLIVSQPYYTHTLEYTLISTDKTRRTASFPAFHSRPSRTKQRVCFEIKGQCAIPPLRRQSRTSKGGKRK
jgi:hypothetical protein